MLFGKKKGVYKPKSTVQIIRDWCEAIAITFVIAFGIIRPFIFELYRVPTGSMETTINVGDRIFVDKYTYLFSEPKKGDIIVFEFNIELFYSTNLYTRINQIDHKPKQQ